MKSRNQLKKEIEAVFKRYGVGEFSVSFVSAEGSRFESFQTCGGIFRAQLALNSLNNALKMSQGEK